ncbi:MAG TPA: hypothetical protein VNQ90_02760 [Chthoniobacteraceae bacterium]|nr:hypothetical protein [Chthoniobacteraceae bacterium]
MLKPYITPRVQELVRGRLLEGLRFFDKRVLRPEYSRAEVKLALLLIRIANPQETLVTEEFRILERLPQINPTSKPARSTGRKNVKSPTEER